MQSYSNLKIVTQARTFYNGPVLSVELKTKSGGSIVLQPNRSELLTTIDICKLVIKDYPDNNEKVYSISDGIVYADKSSINIITNDIILNSDIDLKKAESDRDKAISILSSNSDAEVISRFEIKLKKAINRINVSQHK
ncbi:ATP synthase epsilon chain [Mycoplasmopsis agalactiae 14628]|uniref:ATP synthase epsilon chain n=1 Tax=Mycoplasmopsis agalactiae 14628 TaxID=1110504 RepID=I5D526_MYCAA|nr:ATP synthase delta/epsilon chain alpha-helix domain-containing protein [Mycoplasmopsis agalactiae]EIN14785.1 ATP synthase epsilon chain [Mycoplasmopsis agalactiae 14628]